MTEYQYSNILRRLDSIIRLLEFQNSINQGRIELNIDENDAYAPSFVDCTCHKKGSITGVETCPVHG